MELINPQNHRPVAINAGHKICCWCGQGINWTVTAGPLRGVAFSSGDAMHQKCDEESEAQMDQMARELSATDPRILDHAVDVMIGKENRIRGID